MAKTTKLASAILEQFYAALAHYEEVVKIKKMPLENQASHIREKSMDFYDGWIAGMQAMTENVLHNQHCYKGFFYVDSKGEHLLPEDGQYISDHPEYKSFRVNYYQL